MVDRDSSLVSVHTWLLHPCAALFEDAEGFDLSKGMWRRTGWKELDGLRKVGGRDPQQLLVVNHTRSHPGVGTSLFRLPRYQRRNTTTLHWHVSANVWQENCWPLHSTDAYTNSNPVVATQQQGVASTCRQLLVRASAPWCWGTWAGGPYGFTAGCPWGSWFSSTAIHALMPWHMVHQHCLTVHGISRNSFPVYIGPPLGLLLNLFKYAVP
jgi:hypothetical protein